jgi:hypothetical protein
LLDRENANGFISRETARPTRLKLNPWASKFAAYSSIFPFLRLAITQRRRNAMLTKLVAAAFISAITFSTAFAGAQDLCNDTHMKQMDEVIAKMTDAAKEKEATMHLDMSKAAMKKGDIEVWNGLNVPQTPGVIC